ncbi:MAG TPA: DUF1707 domain-containing protein [Spirochaetia bacterium]|nr:DUF1707 domain-containing protein [Spirochaetia bacterium]
MYPVDPNDARAADSDRQRVAELLGEALAAGRLTSEEHEERLRVAFAAKTMGQLKAITYDLPAAADAPAAPKRLGALFSKILHGGPMSLPPVVAVRSLFGAAYFNLSHAEFSGNSVDIDARCLFGKIVITVPASARVEDDGTAIFGKRSLPSTPAESAGGPLIRIHGKSIFGKITVWRAGTKRPDFHPWNPADWQNR